MQKLFFAVSAAALIVLGNNPATAQSSSPAPDPAIYGAIPSIQSAEISPDGNTLAVLQYANGQSTVVFLDLTDPSASPKGVGVGDVSARTIEWVDNDYLLLLASIVKESPTRTGMQMLQFFRWIAINKDERKSKVLFQKDAGYYVEDSGRVAASALNEPGKTYFTRWTPQAKVGTGGAGYGSQAASQYEGGLSVFRADLASGRDKLIEGGETDTVDWIVDANGEPVMRIDYDPRSNTREIHRKKPGSGRFSLVKEIKEESGAGASIVYHGMAGSPDEAYATTYTGGNTVSLVKYNLETDSISETVFNNPNYDLDSVVYDTHTATVAGVRYTDDMPKRTYLDPAVQKVQDNLQKALPGSTPVIMSRSADNNNMLVRANYTDRPSEFYIFNKDTRNLSFFSGTYQGFENRPYVKRTKFDYQSSDGKMIPGYLTTPLNVAAENLPLIVLPHGGPEARDTMAFDWWSGFYAASGYAVYQPNFRGSDGYGAAFRRAGRGEWGRKMQDDITEGVHKLIADGVVDRDRVCIVGASYGGYAALAGATLTPGMYACAVSVNGVANLQVMLGEAARSGQYSIAYWQKWIGNRFRDTAAIKAVSPEENAAKATAPIMLIHGKDDTVVPFHHSKRMNDALASAGKTSELVALDGEDHWLSQADTRAEMLRRSIEFIDRHIGQ